MSRPVKARTLTSFTRDIETLSRLRMAILLDAEIDPKLKDVVREQIDALMNSLVSIAQTREV